MDSFYKLHDIKEEHLDYLRKSILSTTKDVKVIEALKNAHATLKEQCGEQIAKSYSTNLGEPSFRFFTLFTMDELGMSNLKNYRILNACLHKNVSLYDMDPGQKLSCLVRANERKLPSERFIPNRGPIVPGGKLIAPGKVTRLEFTENLSTEGNGVDFLESIDRMLSEGEGHVTCVKQVPVNMNCIGLLRGILKFVHGDGDVGLKFDVCSKSLGMNQSYDVHECDSPTLFKQKIEENGKSIITPVFTVCRNTDNFPHESKTHKFLSFLAEKKFRM